MKLASQLKKLISKNDMTVAQLSRATNVSDKMIYSWLDNNHPKDLNSVKKIADFFDVSLDFILFDITRHEKKLSIEDLKEEISLGVLELIVRKPKGKT